MNKSATDVMQEIIFSAVIDSIMALKDASKGMPNTLLRDLNTVHPNTTFADLPKELQTAISASVRAAFTKLLKEGYTVANPAAAPQRPAPQGSAPQRTGPPRRDGMQDRRPPRGDRPPRGAPGDRPSRPRPPGGGDRPSRPRPSGGKPGGKPRSR